MGQFDFQALGTVWSVVVDGSSIPDDVQRTVVAYARDFESRFSRFLPSSEVNAFREVRAGTYPISPEFARLLQRAEQLRRLTDGVYDPVVGGILEEAGYGGQSGLRPVSYGEHVPQWSVSDDTLTVDGPVAFDLGGIGKGYCIDQVADVVRRAGFEYFLVDGGGDMYATTKADGRPWRAAIEYPGKPELAAGVVELSHQGLAVSDIFRRRFGAGHHLIDVKAQESVQGIVGCAAVAVDAWAADCMTSGLFFASSKRYLDLAQEFEAQYLVFYPDGETRVSPDWSGELFAESGPLTTKK